MGKLASSQGGLEGNLPVLRQPHALGTLGPGRLLSGLVTMGGEMTAIFSISLALSSMCFPGNAPSLQAPI